jgi:hypothetical protein
LDPEDARSGWNGDTLRVAHRSREVGGDGRITDGQVNVPPAGGASEVMKLQSAPRVDPEFRTKERLAGPKLVGVVLWWCLTGGGRGLLLGED